MICAFMQIDKKKTKLKTMNKKTAKRNEINSIDEYGEKVYCFQGN